MPGEMFGGFLFCSTIRWGVLVLVPPDGVGHNHGGVGDDQGDENINSQWIVLPCIFFTKRLVASCKSNASSWVNLGHCSKRYCLHVFSKKSR